MQNDAGKHCEIKNENANEDIATNYLREWQRQVTNILSLSQILKLDAINFKRKPDPDNQEPVDDIINTNKIQPELDLDNLEIYFPKNLLIVVDSPIMALCCDVIQNDFFAKWNIRYLMNNYKDAINVLRNPNFELLQFVTVALLKEFINCRWSSLESVQNTETEHLMFIDKIKSIDEVINDLAIERQYHLIRSLNYIFSVVYMSKDSHCMELNVFVNYHPYYCTSFLHSSSSPPLAAYLQTSSACKDTYILTSHVDKNHRANSSNTRLDVQAINRSVEIVTKLCYVYESIESRKYIDYRLRDLTP
ncbi:15302_t:CDS:2, partial [Racocetra persica]